MAKKLIRGTVVGGMLGIVCGLLLSYTVFFVKQYTGSKETYARDIEGSPYISVMSTDSTTMEDVFLRFHVRANSNSDEDIALKYEVRDAVLDYLDASIDDDAERDEVINYINDNLDEIKKLCQKTIVEAGYTYPVNVYITNDYFPMRQYGEMVIPAGDYDALRIDIGEAKGENFWCLLYPMMCYTIDSGAVVSRDDEERLSDCLSDEEYEALFIDMDTGDNDVEIKFKLIDWISTIL